MAEISKEYRYHPENEDMLVLCKQFEQRLPNAQFNHKYIRDSLTGDVLVRIEAWDSLHSRYYSQTLRPCQEPEDIAARFYESLHPRNTKS